MVDEKYLTYAKKGGGVQLAALQAEFKLNYREAKKVVDGMIAGGYIEYDGGLNYKYVKDIREEEELMRRVRKYRAPVTRPLSGFSDDEPITEDETDEKIRTLFRKLRADIGVDDEDENDEFDFLTCDEDDEDEKDLFDDDDFVDGDLQSILDSLKDETPVDEREDLQPFFKQLDAFEEVEKKKLYESLLAAINKAIEIKSAPLSTEKEPDRSLWRGENLDCEVFTRIEKLVLSDKNLALKGAIKKAETYLDAVRDTHDRKMAQLYEHIVYRLKTTTSYQFNLVRKYLYDPDEE